MNIVCSFCGASLGETKQMITGKDQSAICNECVKLCVEILFDQIPKMEVLKHGQ